MDYTTLTDEELDEHRIMVLSEQERRARLAAAPEQARVLAAAYEADGGDPADLVAAIRGE
jgi:hypothetical protein